MIVWRAKTTGRRKGEGWYVLSVYEFQFEKYQQVQFFDLGVDKISQATGLGAIRDDVDKNFGTYSIAIGNWR